MSKKSRVKGHSFEREVANLLRPIFPEARRKLEYQWQTASGVDLDNTGIYKIQCKRSRSTIPIRKIKEIKEDGVHVLISKKDHEEIMATLYFTDFLKLIELAKQSEDKLNK